MKKWLVRRHSGIPVTDTVSTTSAVVTSQLKMKNLHFYLFFFAAGISTISGQKDFSTENETEAPDNRTKNSSDFKSMNENVKKNNRQGFLITPDDRLLIDQRLFQKSEFLQDDGYVPPVRIPVGGRRQKIQLKDDTGRYNVQLENFQYENPTYFQAALGAISAHLINQRTQEYVPYPPNGDPHNYPAYRGHPHATEPPVIRAYERSSSARYEAPPYDRENRAFAENIYPGRFENYNPGFYAGFEGSPEQVRSPERIDKWYGDQRGGPIQGERVFYSP